MTTNQTIDGVPRELLERVATEADHMLGFTYASNSEECRSAVDELRALLDAPTEQVEVCNADNADQALTLLDFALSFALCNLDHGGTRRDVKKAQAHLEAYRKFKAEQAQGEGEPFAWYTEDYLSDKSATTYDLATMERWKAKGWPVKPLYIEQPAPVAVEYKIHMGEALKVFDALKVERIARKVEQEDLGPMGATEVETWSTSIGVTLEMHTAMGGCTLIVRTATVAVVMPEREAMRDIIAQAIGGDAYDCTRVWSAWGVGTMSDDDFIPIADQEERLYEIADACLDAVTRLNPSL